MLDIFNLFYGYEGLVVEDHPRFRRDLNDDSISFSLGACRSREATSGMVESQIPDKRLAEYFCIGKCDLNYKQGRCRTG